MASGVISLVLPVPVVGIADKPTLDITLPMFTISMVGGGVGSALVLPMPVVVMSGGAPISSLAMVIPAPSISISSTYEAIRGDISVNLPSIDILMGGVNARAALAMTLPMLDFSTIRPNAGLIEILLPTPRVFGYGSVSPATVSYYGIVMNLARQAITTYSSYPFNSLAYYNGQWIGATSTGIYHMSGDLDKTSIITAKARTGTLDLGSDFIKHIRDIWLTYRSDGNISIMLEVDEDTDNPVEMITQASDDKMHEERLGAGTGGVPRGLRGRFYTIELKNVDGSSFDVHSISLLVDAIRRKLR